MQAKPRASLSILAFLRSRSRFKNCSTRAASGVLVGDAIDEPYEAKNPPTIFYAIADKDFAAVERILKAHPEQANAEHEDVFRPLHVAALAGNKAITRVLLDAGADVYCRGSAGETPLHCAVRCDHAYLVKILLQAGADVNAHMDDGATALDIAYYRALDMRIASQIRQGWDGVDWGHKREVIGTLQKWGGHRGWEYD